MAKTFLDPLVEFPAIAIRAIGNDKTVVSLLTDNPDIEMESDEADAVYDKFLYDYGYIDETTTENVCYICVEADNASMTWRERTKNAFMNMQLYVTIVCHKRFMDIDPSKFPKMLGNRRDNIARYVDLLINGSNLFGVGALTLKSARTLAAPIGFCIRELVYEVPAFGAKNLTVAT